ncbi:uncharacterized protein LOC110059524 isoform X3 [Orbicella faveolata]|uniref:uncharacterized protein LOC110059524 isoform X3 n=1 Tax=Orbicella faveolata TaxID=48498 RepID=UPI0009E5F6DA|nr:uncharacterized protein LOC110059524 isoform X3 [Orbicella faveolata]
MLEERRGEYECVKEQICVPRASVVERRFSTLVRRRLRTEGSREKVQNRKSTDSSASPKTSKKQMKVPGKKYKTKNLSYQIVRLMEKDGFKSERCCTIFSTLTPVVSLKMF